MKRCRRCKREFPPGELRYTCDRCRRTISGTCILCHGKEAHPTHAKDRKDTICAHCDDVVPADEHCVTCGRYLSRICLECHEELAHGQVANANIHLTGNSHVGLTPRQATKVK